MTYFIDTTGQPTLGIGVCDRCRRKFPLMQLMRDPNSPGLRVCEDDLDQFDPYRLPARQSERINLPFVRPDVPVDGVGFPLQGHLLTEAGDRLVTEDGGALLVEGEP